MSEGVNPVSLVMQTASQLRDAIQKGDVRPQEVVEAFLQRIESVDPGVGAFLAVRAEEALREADEAERQGGFGVPIGVKDNISTAGTATTCASRMLANYVPPFDATVVTRLKAAGVPNIGKTNLDEFAMGSSTETSAFKQTRNPWNRDRVPGGSSGGSAAAVAAHLVPWALGSDTGGSIRQPAALCGIVGLKPTYGRVSRFGLIPLAPSLDCIGPMTKDVRDAAVLLNLIAGYDPQDGTSAPGEAPDFTASLGKDVRGLKIGLPKEMFGTGVDPEVVEAVRQAASVLEGLGAAVEETSLPHAEDALAAYYVLATAEAASSVARYDGVRYGYRSEDAPDTIRMFENTRAEGFGPEVKWRAVLGTWVLSGGRRDTLYARAQKVRALIRRDFMQALERFDVLLAPASPTAAFPLGAKRDDVAMYASDLCTLPASLAGVPALSVPCGLNGEGLPLGLQLMGRPFEEALVLQVGYAYEQAVDASRWRLAEEVS